MDRPENGLIKWSPNAAHDSFLHISLQHRVVQLYEATGLAQKGQFEYKKFAKHDDFPPLTTYDWSPTAPGLVVVGTSTGIVNLLRVDDNSNAYMELGLKVSRTCQAVAFSTAGKLAVALDRVRSDHCLYIWDVNRLSNMDATVSGFPADIPSSDPMDKLEFNASVSSIRFFEDNPNVLVAGIKGSGIRIHDLRGNPSQTILLLPIWGLIIDTALPYQTKVMALLRRFTPRAATTLPLTTPTKIILPLLPWISLVSWSGTVVPSAVMT